MTANKEKILVVRLSALGDVVRCLPALAALRTALPQAQIGWVVETASADILQGHPDLDEVIVMPRKEWSRCAKNPLKIPGVLLEMRRFFRDLRGRGYDTAIDFQGNMRSAWVARRSGAGRRLGFASPASKEGSARSCTQTYSPPDGAHRLTWNMGLLSLLGIEDPEVRWRLPDLSGQQAEVERIVAEMSGDGPLVVMHPGVSRFGAYKQWPAERFARLAARLRDECGARVLLTRGPGEEKLCLDIARQAGEGISVAAMLSLRGLAALMGRADLFVGADTGPMHIAAAAGAPLVTIFGPKDEKFYGPYCEQPAEVLFGEAPCRRCKKRRCDDPVCVTGVSVEEVFEAAKKILTRR